ncbi:MAG: PQQ-like beta-propeller repeat protein [Bifidobacteriaceae bacterium]|nr:PQQ-like beta-propeller repeat protein [Bifidobacteriaceae bacterium]
MAVLAAVAAVTLAAGAVWWFGLRDSATERLGQGLPSVIKTPALGKVVSTRDVMGGDFAQTDFVGFFDDNTGLVSGTNEWGAGVLEATARSDGGGAGALVGVDLTTHREKWRIELAETLGLGSAASISSQAEVAEGLALVQVRQTLGTGEPGAAFLVTVDSRGRIVSQRQAAADAELVGLRQDVAVLQDASRELVGYNPAALNEPLWRAPGASATLALSNAVSGTWWILARDGFIDARTGTAVGFGADLAEGGDRAPMYYLAEGSQDVVLRHSLEAGSAFTGGGPGTVVRVDPATGRELWEKGLAVNDSVLVALVAGDTLVFDYLGAQTEGGVVAANVESGRQLWYAKGEGLRRGANGVAVTVSHDFQRLTTRDWRSGEEKASHSLAEAEWLMGVGTKVAYVADNAGVITGLSLTDGLRRLWTLDTAGVWPDGNWATTWLIASPSKLFLCTQSPGVSGDGAGTGSGPADARQVALVELKR